MNHTAPKYKFTGKEGMKSKIRQLAMNLQSSISGLPRTMVFAVSAPDPMCTPDCQMSNPLGVKVLGLDHQMNQNDIALLIGITYGFLDQYEDQNTMDYGEEFREAVDLARSIYGHSTGMCSAVARPQSNFKDAPKWKN